jgi:hypothetical protein
VSDRFSGARPGETTGIQWFIVLNDADDAKDQTTKLKTIPD